MLDLRLTSTTPVLVQGISRPQGVRQAEEIKSYGTNVGGGVSADGGPNDSGDITVFRSCTEAVSATHALACVTTTPPETTADAVLEAAEAGIRVIVSLAKGVPAHDTIRVLRRIRELGTIWIGSASSGIAIPSEHLKLGWIPNYCLGPGRFAVIAKCDALAYEVGQQMVASGLGQSIWIDVGNEPLKGTRLADLVPFLKQDETTVGIILAGSAGGTDEEEFADAIKSEGLEKPVAALLPGLSFPETFAATHVESLPGATATSAARKRAALEAAGASVYNSVGALVKSLQDIE